MKVEVGAYMKKRIVVFLLLSCIVVGITGSYTYAYLTSKQGTDNIVGMAYNKVHIDENYAKPNNPSPGDRIQKNPKVVNDSNVSVYVRMRADFSDSDAMNQCEPLQIDGNWTKKSDGYYYYNKEVPVGGSTSSLFTFVKIRNDVNKDELIPFDIICYCESVQAFGFKTADEAWSSINN